MGSPAIGSVVLSRAKFNRPISEYPAKINSAEESGIWEKKRINIFLKYEVPLAQTTANQIAILISHIPNFEIPKPSLQ